MSDSVFVDHWWGVLSLLKNIYFSHNLKVQVLKVQLLKMYQKSDI